MNRLDETQIRKHFSPAAQATFLDIEIFQQIDSTNTYAKRLIDQAKDKWSRKILHGNVYLAEEQTQGRGRSGKKWISPFASTICCSIIWQFKKGLSELAGLSLTMGLAVLTTLAELGVKDLQLKWPNDVLVEGKKISGVLIETASSLLGPAAAVIGIGMNVTLPPEQGAEIDQPWISLAQLTSQPSLDRNHITGLLLNQVLLHLQQFVEQGFAPLRERWLSYDSLFNQAVVVDLGNEKIEGIAKGIDRDGAVRLVVGNEVRCFSGGEIRACSPSDSRANLHS